MKSLSIDEIDLIVEHLQSLVSGQVQDIVHNGDRLIFSIYVNSELYYLHLVLNSLLPGLAVEKADYKARQKGKGTPLRLFLKANIAGRRLFSIRRVNEYGRLLEMVFGMEDPYRIEFRLFPHGVNVSVFAGEKAIHLKKPKELSPVDEGAGQTSERENLRK